MIEDIIKEYNEVRQRESELSFMLSKHFNPIINKLFRKKDKDGLEQLLLEIPDSLVKMALYESLRKLKNNS